MSIQSILRQKQINEMLNYDIVQNKRVFDNEVKQVAALNEVAAAPKRSDVEFEASVRQRVEEIILLYIQLRNFFGDLRRSEYERTRELTLPSFMSRTEPGDDDGDDDDGDDDDGDFRGVPESKEAEEEEETKEEEEEEETKEEEAKEEEAETKEEKTPVRIVLEPSASRKTAAAYIFDKDKGFWVSETTGRSLSTTSSLSKQLTNKMNALRKQKEFVRRAKDPVESIKLAEEVERKAKAKERRLIKKTEGKGRYIGGVNDLSEAKFESRTASRITEILSGIYTRYNSLVEYINNKFRLGGISSQGQNNILSMLQPLVDSTREALFNITETRQINKPLYDRIYTLLYEIITSIENAPPLLRLDITKIQDKHFDVRVPPNNYEDYLENKKLHRELLSQYGVNEDADEQYIMDDLALESTLDDIETAIESTEVDIAALKTTLLRQRGTLNSVQLDQVKNQIRQMENTLDRLNQERQKFQTFRRQEDIKYLGTGKNKKGGAYPPSTNKKENAAVQAQKVSNQRAKKQMEMFDKEAQNKFGAPTYRGLKPDNSLGTLGSGMSQDNKEKMQDVNKISEKQQLKEKSKRGKKSLSKKMEEIPVLVYDDKRNDWYL